MPLMRSDIRSERPRVHMKYGGKITMPFLRSALSAEFSLLIKAPGQIQVDEISTMTVALSLRYGFT